MAAATSSPASGSSPIPLASGDYATAAATANAAYQNALASINSQRQQALQSFGYTGQIDPATGQLTNMQVDANNPFGQYQQLLAGGASDQAGVQAADAARGIGNAFGPRGGGLAAQGLTTAKLNFGANSANLGENLMGTLGNLTSQQQDAQNTMNNALWQAELASAQNAIQNQDFNPADFSGVTDQPVTGGKVPAPQTVLQPNPGPATKEPVIPKVGSKASRTPPNIRAHRGTETRNTFHKAVQVRAARRPKAKKGRR